MKKLSVASMPKIFCDNKRFSELRKPRIGSTVWFSPTTTLTRVYLKPLVSFTSSLSHLHLLAKGKVVANRRNVVEVLFDGAKESDLVTPELLESRKLTEFGKMLFKKSKKNGNVINERSKKE